MGAHSSLTLGMFGANGGLACQRGGPAQGGVMAGYKTEKTGYTYFPFYETQKSEKDRYVAEKDKVVAEATTVLTEKEIEREYLWATDRFIAPGMTFEVLTPFFGIPDPKTASQEDMKFASCPVIFVRLCFDNSSSEDWQGFFALSGDNHWSTLHDRTGGEMVGMISREQLGFATLDGAEVFSDFTVENALERKHLNPDNLLGQTAGLTVNVPAGTKKTITVAIGTYIGGQVTFNHATRYWYTRYFSGITDVLSYGLGNLDGYQEQVDARDNELQSASGLNDEQKFMIAHATRSYYGSTQWLDDGGEPLWVVNEGEYLMMNTFDLAVDMLFYEMRFNPWTVKNVLETFIDRYRYYDEVFDPADPSKMHKGGVSFCHDMGVANHFSPEGRSSYELSGLDRECFSYMTCEQLTNWVLCAGVYITGSNDDEFLQRHRDILKDCLDSLLIRDNPVPELRSGLMQMESSRTHPGGEITTYDSLDHSLGQSRKNIYLGGKCWASYVILQHLFDSLGDTENTRKAGDSAQRTVEAIVTGFDDELGYIPAILDGENISAIIPAIEALIYPFEMGLGEAVSPTGPYGAYIETLKKHFATIYKPGVCIYDDGGWKLSSSADNSWMSKIALCQYVARHILGIDLGESGPASDIAHGRWQREGSKYFACSDQFTSGKAIGSRYYPRIVTSILWLKENKNT